MKILVLAARSPSPPKMADALTVNRLLRYLAQRGHDVDLLSFVENEREEAQLREDFGGICHEIRTVPLPPWQAYLNTVLSLPSRAPMQVAYYRSKAMRRLVEQTVAGGSYDVLYTHSIRVSEHTRDLAVPKLVGVQLSQALNLGRMVQNIRDPFRRLFYQIERAKVRPYEAAICADYDRALLCGRSDIAALEETAPVPNAVVCPHGQDMPPIERVRAVEKVPGSIVISGVMSTFTNVDAVEWFAREVFPRVEAEVPEAAFWIVGREPQRRVLELARPPRVVVTGEVPDVADWLCRAEVGVAPLRVGAGMQNKLVQAMGCELPVVATRVANEGIGSVPEQQILIRDDAETMATAVVELLRDAALRRRIGQAARRFVETHWTWDHWFGVFEELMGEVARGEPGGSSAG